MVVMFLNGVSAAASLLAGLLFLRFWRETDDRLFAWLAVAFCLFGASWTAVSLVNSSGETRHLVYLVRLGGFIVILVGVLEKHLTARPGRL